MLKFFKVIIINEVYYIFIADIRIHREYANTFSLFQVALLNECIMTPKRHIFIASEHTLGIFDPPSLDPL